MKVNSHSKQRLNLFDMRKRILTQVNVLDFSAGMLLAYKCLKDYEVNENKFLRYMFICVLTCTRIYFVYGGTTPTQICMLEKSQ